MESGAFFIILGFAVVGAASLLQVAALREDHKRLRRRRERIQQLIELRILIAQEELKRSRLVAGWSRARLEAKSDR